DDCAVGLLGELARLEGDLATTDLDGHRGMAPGADRAHLCFPFTLPIWRKVEVWFSLASSARSSTKRPPPVPDWELAAEAELLDEGSVALEVLALQVVQKPTAATDQLQEPTPREVILRVGPEMLGEIVDALGQHRDLHLGRAGVLAVRPVLVDELLLRF